MILRGEDKGRRGETCLSEDSYGLARSLSRVARTNHLKQAKARLNVESYLHYVLRFSFYLGEKNVSQLCSLNM